MPTYGERNLEFAAGKGCYLYTPSGKKYLDFAGGIAVNSLGHCHHKLVNVLIKQSKTLWHTSNLYRTNTQEIFAKELCKKTFADKVFFTNSRLWLPIIRYYIMCHRSNYRKKTIKTNPRI